jgi:uncharacterized protein (DUF362 family)/NAD-dependent dihydropyrimidine dehydrogenase PreA subunit
MSKIPVALAKCDHYDEMAVAAALTRAVDLVGGMSRYVQPGQRVLLKINLLRAAAPEEAITTHPAVIKAAVRLVQAAGGEVVIGDSPGGPFRLGLLRSAYRKSGLLQIAEETGAELNEDIEDTLVSLPQGERIKALEVGNFVTNADVVIPISKLKTHMFMGITGATKVLFGVIPGTAKLAYHAKFPEPEDFGDMLLDIITLIKPALSIIDGITGMDGHGPSGGDPFEIGALLASPDPVALDTVAAHLVNVDPRGVYPLRAAANRGLPGVHLEEIELLGDSLDALKKTGFNMPVARAGGEGGAFTLIGRLAKSWLIASPRSNVYCIGCGICAQNCPVDAITITEKKRAVMDLNICIRCYCCHEMCPEKAIDLNRPWIGRMLA